MVRKTIFLPFWLRDYRQSFLKADLTAALLVAVMLIPQSMAYAMLAGLPPVYGLYASTLPLVAYSLLGSSRHLAVGPVAILSLLVAAACSPLAVPGTVEYLQLVTLLTLMVGVFQFVLGVLRVGFLVNFVSRAVVSGFISAGAIIIGLSQARHLLGVDLASRHSTVELLVELAARLGETNLPTALLGLGAVGVLAVMKRKCPRFPAALVVVAGSTALVYLLRLDRYGISIVGEVPGGLPGWSSPVIEWGMATRLFPAAMVILFVGYMESVAVSQWVASREKYRISPNREFLGLGAANIVAALFSGYAVTGGFSRTAVNHQAGAKSPLAAVATALLLLAVLIFFTPLFYYLPQTVLAAIIIVAVSGLIDVKSAMALFRVKKADGWTLLATFSATLLIGAEQGILVGVGFSLLLFIARSAYPRTSVLGYVEEKGGYRDLQHYPQAVTHPGVVIMRVDASLYFANARFVEDHVREELNDKPEVKWLIFDMSGVNDIDGEAIATLGRLLDDFAPRRVGFAFASVKAQVRDVISRADWSRYRENIFEYPNLEQAMREIKRSMRIPGSAP